MDLVVSLESSGIDLEHYTALVIKEARIDFTFTNGIKAIYTYVYCILIFKST